MNSKVTLKVGGTYTVRDIIFYANLIKQRAEFFVPGFALDAVKITTNSTVLFNEDLVTRLQLLPCLEKFEGLELNASFSNITVLYSDDLTYCIPGIEIWRSETPFSIAFNAVVKKGYKVQHAKYTVINGVSYNQYKKTLSITMLNTLSLETFLNYIK